eukprot:8615557-Ditylum_brightwellii.AAC.1
MVLAMIEELSSHLLDQYTAEFYKAWMRAPCVHKPGNPTQIQLKKAYRSFGLHDGEHRVVPAPAPGCNILHEILLRLVEQ